MSLKTHPNDRKRLILTALAAAIVIMLVVSSLAIFVPFQATTRVEGKWVRFGLVSIALLAYSIATYWKLRKSLTFWAVFLGYLAIHMLGVGYFFYFGRGLPLLLFGPICGIEWALMALIVYWILGVGPSRVSLDL